MIFNNRDDHPKNFAWLMSATGQWSLAPAYDVTYCEGPGGYHQMDIMGEALNIRSSHLLKLGIEEAGYTEEEIRSMIARFIEIATRFTDLAETRLPGKITNATLNDIQNKINFNINLLQQ